MKKIYASFRLVSLLSLMILIFSFSSTAQINLVVNTPLCFSAMDNNATYDEDLIAGQITVHSLVIQNGGSISYNDPGNPCSDAGAPNTGAKPVSIIVINNMEIQAGGFINTENKIQAGNGGDIALTIGGTFTMRGPAGATPGAKISSSNLTATSGGKNAGSIIIHVIGDVDLDPGSTITAFSYKGTGGWVEITSQNNIDIDGNVLSQSTGSGAGTNQGHGGVIWITAVKNLFISDEGVVSSKGVDPGADLVHLCGCSVVIYGLVESTGSGHGIPSNPPNHLITPFRPDKPANSTAGVEVWSGSTIIIDNLDHNGQVNGDLCCAGGADGTSWVDIFAKGNITIIGSTDAADKFAVHANGASGNTDDGGIVTVKSEEGSITASGRALQADGTAFGGDIIVEADNSVVLNNATLFSRGDFNASGGLGTGGHINIRSFNGAITWQNGVGDVRPTGTNASLLVSERGEINFKKCTPGAVNVTGSTFPNNGLPATTPTTLGDECDGEPTFETYVSFCECDGTPREVICQLSGPLAVCAGSTGHVYDGGPIPSDYTFKWTVFGAGASILNGIDDQQTVTIDAGSVNYIVTLTMIPDDQTIDDQVCIYQVTVYANPAIYTLTGSSICPGATGSVTLSNSQTGVSYQLKKSSDDSDIPPAKNGTNGQSLTWTLLPAGSYYVVATGALPTECTSETDPAEVTEVDGPAIYTLTGSAICESDPNTGTVTLSDSDDGVSYQLKKSSDDSDVDLPKDGDGSSLTWTGLAAGSYYVVAATDEFECPSETEPASVAVVNNPAVYNLSGSSVCAGNTGSVTLSNSQTGVTYQLRNDANDDPVQAPKNGSTGNSLTWTGLAPGTYYVLATGAAPTECTSETSPASVSETVCDGHIFPTATGCPEFVSGTPELDGICVTYGNNGKVSNATPGVFFYYTYITAPANNGSFTVDIVQSAACSNKLFGIKKDQVIAWSSPGCAKLTTGTESPNGQAHITITGVTQGTVIVISVKYDTKTIIGATLTSPCTFNFVAKIGGVEQPDTDGSIIAATCDNLTRSNNQEQHGSEVNETKNAFSVYPNPVRSVARINYTLYSTQSVSVKVFNSVGKEITTLVNTKQAAGTYNVEWNAGRLAAGSYFVQIRTGNETSVKKLILIK